MIGVNDAVGSIEQGKIANFIITTGNVFNEKSSIIENWIQGKKYAVKSDKWSDAAGSYTLIVTGDKGSKNFTLQVKSASAANIIGNDTIATKFSYDGKLVKISFPTEKKSSNNFKLSGMSNGNVWNGYGEDNEGNKYTWTANLNSLTSSQADTTKKENSFEIRCSYISIYTLWLDRGTKTRDHFI